MELEEIAMVLSFGAFIGLGVRYLLALEMRSDRAILYGVLTVTLGPWVFDQLTGATSDWFASYELAAAAVILLALGTAPSIYRHMSRSRLRQQRQPRHLQRAR